MERENNQKFIKKDEGINIRRFTMMILTVICLSTAFVGCNITKEKAEAENVTKIYFDQIKDKNYDKLLEIYSSKFFEKVKPEEYVDMLKTINKKLGDLKSYSLQSWKVNENFGTSNNGTYYYLTYKVEYSKYTAQEQFTLFKPKGEEEVKIIGHNTNSDGLLKE
jgi:hypothetical protein